MKREFREVLSALWRWDEGGGAVMFPCGTEAGYILCNSPPVLPLPASRAHRYPFVHPLVGGLAPNPLFSAVLRPAAAHLSAERRAARYSAFGSVCDGEDDILFEIAEFFSEYI